MKLLALHCNPRLVFCGGHFLTLPSHNNSTKVEMVNGQLYAPQLPVSEAFLVVVWLSYLQTRPAHQRCPRPPCLQGPRARDCFQCHLLESPVLQADTRPPERITSHDSHQPIRVSDRSIVSGYCSCPFLCADLLNRFVQNFVASLRWFQLHRQIPSTRCRRELDLLSCSRIKTETLPVWSKTNSSTTICHLCDRHQGSSTVDFSARWPLAFLSHQRCTRSSFLDHTLCLGLRCCTHIQVVNLCGPNTHVLQGDWQEQQFCMLRYQYQM